MQITVKTKNSHPERKAGNTSKLLAHPVIGLKEVFVGKLNIE